jgi:hypothetical protein
MTRDDAKWPHARWCERHGQYHGTLYNCEKYPPAVRAEIAEAAERYRRNLNDPAWQRRQLDNGVPPVVLAIFGAMAS